MESFLLVLHIFLSFVIVIAILLQSGKGGGLGAGFSNAAAMGQEVFGGRGAAGFLEKLTVVLGVLFMVTSMALAWYSSKPQSALDLDAEAEEPVQSQVHDVVEHGAEGVAVEDVVDEEELRRIDALADPTGDGDTDELPGALQPGEDFAPDEPEQQPDSEDADGEAPDQFQTIDDEPVEPEDVDAQPDDDGADTDDTPDAEDGDAPPAEDDTPAGDDDEEDA